jgi:pyroglutamyl-peptidase
MGKSLLLTSFQTWLPHQLSNSSDDLILELLHHRTVSPSLHVARQLPVDFFQAPLQAIALVNRLRPDVVVCCGMSEQRSQLNLESCAIAHHETLTTPFDVDELVTGLPHTTISDDAGRFVCNYLYYSLLRYIQDQGLSTRCLFVHVPVLTDENRSLILHDFQKVLHRVGHGLSVVESSVVDFASESSYLQSLDSLPKRRHVDVTLDSHAS